jgi:hypothetical protein
MGIKFHWKIPWCKRWYGFKKWRSHYRFQFIWRKLTSSVVLKAPNFRIIVNEINLVKNNKGGTQFHLFFIMHFYNLLVVNTLTNLNVHNATTMCCVFVISTLTLMDKVLQWWTKILKTWSTLNFSNFHNRLECKDMCEVKCQLMWYVACLCYLWGLWVVNVACEV